MADKAKTKQQLVVALAERESELDELRQQRAVQQAAERVREAVLVMRSTADLMDVVGVMHQSLHQLGVEPSATAIRFYDHVEGQVQQYLAVKDFDPYGFVLSPPEGKELQVPTKPIAGGWRVRWVQYPLTDDELAGTNDVQAEARQETRHKGHIATKIINFGPEQLRQGGSTWQVPDPDKADWSVMEPYWGKHDYTTVPFQYGLVSFVVRTVTPEHLSTVQALVEALSHGYLRFLDFQRLEAQAEQARRERAVERIRAEAMAMRSSADLMDVVGVMHQCLHQLGVEPTSTSIHFIDEVEEKFQHYLAIKDLDSYGFILSSGAELMAPTKTVAGGWRVRWTQEPPSKQVDLATWREGRITTQVITSDPKRFLQKGTTWYVPDPDKANWAAWEPFRGEWDHTLVPFEYGLVSFRVRTVSPAHIATVQALTEALSLGYVRFLDFQQLEEQNVQIQQATHHKSDFLAQMSHDLRTPMNAIIGYTRILLRRAVDKLEPRQLQNLENIETSAQNLLALINEILDLSRIEAGRVEVHATDVNVQQLIAECTTSVAPLIKPEVELIQELADAPVLHTDADLLRRVMMNILGNAVKFTEAGSITLALKAADKGIELSIADTGPGIPAEQLPHIFDEFRQVEGAVKTQEGSGLGLAIVKKTVELLGGTIRAESTIDEGTTFILQISNYER